MLRLRELREDRDIKQQDLADLLRCSQVCYSRYETGEREIPLRALVQLAAYYGTSVDERQKRSELAIRSLLFLRAYASARRKASTSAACVDQEVTRRTAVRPSPAAPQRWKPKSASRRSTSASGNTGKS